MRGCTQQVVSDKQSSQTGSAAVRLPGDLGIVVERTGMKKHRVYSYQAYVELLAR